MNDMASWQSLCRYGNPRSGRISSCHMSYRRTGVNYNSDQKSLHILTVGQDPFHRVIPYQYHSFFPQDCHVCFLGYLRFARGQVGQRTDNVDLDSSILNLNLSLEWADLVEQCRCYFGRHSKGTLAAKGLQDFVEVVVHVRRLSGIVSIWKSDGNTNPSRLINDTLVGLYWDEPFC